MRAGLLATGSDDGVIAITRDGGTTWTRTEKFPTVPETTYVSRVAFSRFNEGTIYASLDGHRSNDFKPYVLKSTDYGRTWTSITGDLPAEGSVQVVREHHRERNLLFAGTEYGVYFTVDGGAHWTRLGSGIPTVPGARPRDPGARKRSRGRHARTRHLHHRRPRHRSSTWRARSRRAVAHLFPVQDATLLLPDGSRNSGMGSGGYTGQNPARRRGDRLSRERDRELMRRRSSKWLTASGTVVRQLTCQPHARASTGTVWDMRAGAPLTGPVTVRLPARGGRGAVAAVAVAWWSGGGEITFVAMPGAYRARLTITPAGGAASVMEQPFALLRDGAVILTEAELRQLNATRLTIARLQAGLRETQARLDTAQRQLAEARRAADSSSATPASAKEQIAAMETEVASIASPARWRRRDGGGWWRRRRRSRWPSRRRGCRAVRHGRRRRRVHRPRPDADHSRRG